MRTLTLSLTLALIILGAASPVAARPARSAVCVYPLQWLWGRCITPSELAQITKQPPRPKPQPKPKPRPRPTPRAY